jgi:16S rRNA (uracil1498-N3)-methyltransferase
MEVFYTLPENIAGNQVKLGAEEARHIIRVLRHKVGDRIQVVDGEGNEYRCVITKIGRGELRAEVMSQTRRARETVAEVTLAASITKGTKMDAVVEMATELGVSQIVPLVTMRTVARLTPARVQRFRHLAVAALKSSTRTMLPRIKPPQEFEQFLKDSGYFDLKLLAYEEEKQVRLHEVMTPSPRRVALVIGPEGGFSETEVAIAQARGFRTFSLGPRRLRAETACITGLALLLYELKEL